MNTLIFGASGFIGRALVQVLGDAGETVRAASRHPGVARGTSGPQRIAADLEHAETLPPAFEGIDYAYYLVHSMGAGAGDFRATERRCAENFVRAAADADCRRIVYLGGVAPHGRRSEHLASRLAVGEILRSGSVPAIELRASMVIGNGSASWQILRDLALRLPFMLLPRWLESSTSPIALPDAITALVDARTVPLDPDQPSAWFDIPGPEVLSVREMLAIVGALERRRIPTIRVPVLTPRLSALWLKLVTRANYSIARELVLGLGEDLLPENARYWELTRHSPQWTFREAAAHALASESRGSSGARFIERLVRGLGPHSTGPDARA